MINAETGPISFNETGKGLFINETDLMQYFGAIHCLLNNRKDTISIGYASQLCSLMADVMQNKTKPIELKSFVQCMEVLNTP